MKKTQLQTLVKSLLDEQTSGAGQADTTQNHSDAGPIMEVLQQILSEVRELKTDKTVMESRINHLENNNDYLTRAMMQHQRYLESLDAERRRQTIIITGLAEDTDLVHRDPNNPNATRTAATDEEKVKMIFSHIGHSETQITACQRLGQRQNSAVAGKRPWIRALKVTLDNATDQRKILTNTKQLKQMQEPFSKIYVKKDIHPAQQIFVEK